MIKPIDVKAIEGFRIFVKFEDGVEGTFDLTQIAERGNLFKRWEDRSFFEDVKVTASGARFFGATPMNWKSVAI